MLVPSKVIEGHNKIIFIIKGIFVVDYFIIVSKFGLIYKLVNFFMKERALVIFFSSLCRLTVSGLIKYVAIFSYLDSSKTWKMI